MIWLMPGSGLSSSFGIPAGPAGTGTQAYQGQGQARGHLYFRIDDPYINTHEKAAELIERKIRQELKLSGLVLKDVNIVKCMDSQISGWSEVLPVGISAKNDSFYKDSSALHEEEFLALLQHIRQLVSQAGMEMLEGSIRVNPIKKARNCLPVLPLQGHMPVRQAAGG